MKTTLPFRFGGNYRQRIIERQQAIELIRLRGTAKRPQSPRDVVFQSGSRGGLLVWKLPAFSDDIAGWRIYKDDDQNLHAVINDRGVRQMKIDLSSGATPPVSPIWVCSINAAGVESPKVQVLGVAQAEAGAPPDPNPPTGYTGEGGGGGNTNKYGFGGNQKE